MKKVITALAVTAAMSSASAESPLWMRYPAISPDGKTVAFSYRGDIFTVPASGGEARQLTTSPAYDTRPVWSPDSKSIAFASDREGSLDIFVIPAGGGRARRVTTHSSTELPLAWLNDTTVVFSASGMPSRKAAQGMFQGQTYKVSVNGGAPRMMYSLPMPAVSFDSKGRMLYQDKKGYEDQLRKHERSSGTSDVWLVEDGKFSKLTDFNGHDLQPVWSGDDEFIYVSEEDGTLNIWSRRIDGSHKRQLTRYTTHPVRDISRATNGTVAFFRDGEIYTMKPGEEPERLKVAVVTDDYDRDLVKSVRTSGATDMSVDAKGENVAIVVRGDVYVTSAKYKTTRRITNTPAQERCVALSPDADFVVYDSDRDGQWKLFISKVSGKNEALTYADDVTESLLYASDKAAQQPVMSPDGKKVAFLEDRTTVKVIDLDTKKVTEALPGKYNYSYSDGDIEMMWSPDSRWLLTTYIGEGGWNKEDVALVKADGSETIDLTESGYSNYNPRWAMGGKAVTFGTGKYGMRSHGSWGEQGDVMVMFLDGEAWDEFRSTEEEAELAKKAREEKEKADEEKDGKKKDKKKNKKDKKDGDDDKEEVKPLAFDLANRHYRVSRITPSSTSLGDFILSADGTKLYYVSAATEGSYNLYERNLRSGETKVLAAGVAGGIVPDAKCENLFVISGSGISKVDPGSGKSEPVEFEAVYDRHPSAERAYIYDHVLAQVRDKFYDVNLHGVDWQMYGEAYRRFLPHISNNYDFAELLSELLGELNASHTGGRYRPSSGCMEVAELGAFFDEDYSGPGLKVSEAIARGPLTTAAANIKSGDIILAIDGAEVNAGDDINPLLEGKARKPVRLTVRRNGTGATETVTVKPVGRGTLSNLMYQRWVDNNAAMVDSLSGGRIGYVHVRGMDSPSFREVYSKTLGKYRNCDAIIVDTRYNGGGWLHNDIAQLFGGHQYVRFSPRGQYIGTDPINQWTKPSVMLVNESNYSDAYGTPYVYQTLGVGDLVGAPVPGTMTAVWWETQIDPTLVFGIPEVTCLDNSGQPLENKQLTPEVIVYNSPADVMNGRDAQIEAAVKRLLDKVDAGN